MSRRLPLRAVLFDAVGTLLHPTPCVADAYLAVGARHGSKYDRASIERRFRAAFAAEELFDEQRSAGRTDEARERQRWQRIVASVFDDVADSALLFDELWEHFALPGNWQLDSAASAVWRELRGRGLCVGVASNFDARLHGLCAGMAPLNINDGVFVSSELGWRKPRREFFDAVAEKLKLPREAILLLGDDYENDFRAARAAGWQALWLDRQGAASNDHTLSSLADLPTFVSKQFIPL